jgi:Zn-dependent protease with chaperone function
MANISEPSYEAGEAALKTGNYEEAIAQFEAICEIELDENIVSRSQQALVVAYCKCDRPGDAIALCHRLLAVQDNNWAAHTLEDLIKRYPDANDLGIVPAGKSRPPAPSPANSTILNKDQALIPLQKEASEAGTTVFVPGRQWRNAERAQKWKNMKRPKLGRLWLLQIASAIVLFWMVKTSVEWTLEGINEILVRLPLLQPIQPFYSDPTRFVGIFCLIVFLTFPWYLDLLLKWVYHLEPFSVSRLQVEHPEAAQVVQKMIKQIARKQKMPLPKLGILPTSAPIIFVYGHIPRNARLILSEGLLQHLEDDELGVLIASQLAQIIHRDFVLMSAATALLQIPYTLYALLSQLSDRLGEKLSNLPTPQRLNPKVWQALPFVVQCFLAIPAALFYTWYWLWRVVLLWVSRQRHLYSDRLAAQYMGNPNGLTRALLKSIMGIAQNIEFRQHTSYLLESFDLLMPVGYRQSISLGSIPLKTPFSEVLAWECTNPYRHWLALTNSHPLVGDRIYLLNRYANYWQLPPEIDLPTVIPPARTVKEKLIKLKNSYRALPILQSAVLAAIFLGLAVRGIFWLAGFLNDYVLSIWISGSGVIWLYNADNAFIVRGCILAAFSLSIIAWINGYFPDIRITPTRNEPRLQDLLANSKSVPPRSLGIRISGKLIGRTGISNWLIQDLILQTDSGDIKLHFFTKLCPLGNLFWGIQTPLLWLCRQLSLRKLEAFLQKYIPVYPRPDQFIDQNVTVIGWFRRSSSPWIDVDTIRTQDNEQKVQSGYPVWVTGIAIASALWAAYSIWRA